VLAVCLASTVASNAQTTVDVGGTFQQIGQAANAWIPAIMHESAFLFYVLATLDFAWGAPSFLRESDFTGLFLSLVKKLLVISFFYAVLINGQVWIPAIVNSFAQLGATAAGVPLAQSPSDIMMQGLQIVSNLFTQVSGTDLLTQPGGAITTVLAACIVLASYIIITLHYVVTKLEAIIVMSAGYIFLGFGGSRWTTPYFERYISLAVSTGVRLMLIYLMLGDRDDERLYRRSADHPNFPNPHVNAALCICFVDDSEDGGLRRGRHPWDGRWRSRWNGSGDRKGRSSRGCNRGGRCSYRRNWRCSCGGPRCDGNSGNEGSRGCDNIGRFECDWRARGW